MSKEVKDIADYLHLYLGCEVQWQSDKNNLYRFVGIDNGGLSIKTSNGGKLNPISYKTVKLVLYPLSYAVEQNIIITKTKKLTPNNIQGKPYDILKLLQYDIDLFGLIEAGLAIDKTTLL